MQTWTIFDVKTTLKSTLYIKHWYKKVLISFKPHVTNHPLTKLQMGYYTICLCKGSPLVLTDARTVLPGVHYLK